MKSRLPPSAVVVALLLGLGADAAPSLELLGPSGSVPPEGFLLALRRADGAGASVPLAAPEVSAEGADLLPGPPQPPLRTFVVAPRPGVRQVKVRARDGGLSAEAVFALGPPAARVELALTPATPVKNRDTSAELSVRMLRADGSADPDSAPPVLRANVGAIEGLERSGPGVYRARYVLPRTRYPEVAVLVALSAWPHPQSIHGVFGGLRVPLAAAIDLPGQTEREADLTVTIAGVKYGPVHAAPDGRFKLPVVVPPGFGIASASAVDRARNRRTSTINLMLPPTDQLSCVMNPARLPADGQSKARVLCATSDPFGKVVAATKVTFTALRGSLSPPRPKEEGIVEWIYTAPRVLSSEPDVLTAVWKQGRVTSRDELKVELVQGPAAKVSLRPSEPLVHYAGRLPLEIQVSDSLDRPRPGAKVELSAEGTPKAPSDAGVDSALGAFEAPVEGAAGKLSASWAPPLSGVAKQAELAVTAYGPVGADPARLVVWAEGGALFAGVTDLAGLPVAGQTLKAGEAQVVTGGDGTVRLGPLADGAIEVRHGQWPGLRSTVHVFDRGAVVFPSGARPAARPARAAVELGPPVPVNVRLRVTGRTVSFWVEDAQGVVLSGRPTAVALSGGKHGPISQQAGRSSFTLSIDGPTTVSVSDVATGVTALAEVVP
ncbi:MAG: hypothetical protein ACYC8T_26120 [Myxococcaceae bacterium]